MVPKIHAEFDPIFKQLDATVTVEAAVPSKCSIHFPVNDIYIPHVGESE